MERSFPGTGSRKEEQGAHHAEGDEASDLLPWVGSADMRSTQDAGSLVQLCLRLCFISTFESLFYFPFAC